MICPVSRMRGIAPASAHPFVKKEIPMKKLELDTLQVQSFVTAAAPALRGTVRGRQDDNTEGCTRGRFCEPTGYTVCYCSEAGTCESEVTLCWCVKTYSVEVNCDSYPTNCPCTP